MAYRILIVDDESALQNMVKEILTQSGYETVSALTCAQALDRFHDASPDGVLLDVNLPDGDGFTLFGKLREVRDVPVLFLSARDEDADRLQGLGLGADDYITKPFLPQELLLRLNAVLRRVYREIPDTCRLGDVEVDWGKSSIRRNGEEIALTAKEFSLLKKLWEARGNIVTIDALCAALWDGPLVGYENTLMVHIRRLREKIEADPSADGAGPGLPPEPGGNEEMSLRSIFKGAMLVTAAAALVSFITLAGILAFIFYHSDGGRSWDIPVSRISSTLTWDGTEYEFSGDELLGDDRWAILIGEDGRVIWSLRKPADVPERYSLTDVASFTRWYLNDYPVQCRIRDDGLLVVGAPKGSMWKHDISTESQLLHDAPLWCGGIFLLALGCVLLLAYFVVRRWFRQAQKARDAARSNWINGVSHDIRTPLSVVMGYAAQLEAADLNPAQKNQASAIRVQSQVIRDLVNDLNLTMRLDCEMQALRKEPIQPAAFLRQVAADFLNGGLAEGFELEMDLPETALLPIEADPFLLRRAINNLLTNCVRHNAPGGAIRLGARCTGTNLVLFVKGGTAAGCGPVNADRQLDPDGGAAHGTGLRLVAQIAAAHGGTVRFEQGADKNLCVSMILPIY